MCLRYKQRNKNRFLGFCSEDIYTFRQETRPPCTNQILRADLNPQPCILQLVCVSLVLPGLSNPNCCYSAFCCATRRKRGLPTFRNSNSDWGYTVLHTRIPEGAQWGWKQEVVKFTPARVRTVIYPHQGQWQQMWQDKMKKGTGGGGEEDNIQPRRDASPPSPMRLLAKPTMAVCL